MRIQGKPEAAHRRNARDGLHEALSLTLSVAFNAVLLWWIAAHALSGLAHRLLGVADDAIDIVWLIREPDAETRAASRGAANAVQSEPEVRAAAASRTSATTGALTAQELPDRPVTTVTGMDRWATHALQSSGAPGTDARFRRSAAFQRSGPDLVAVAPRVHLPMRDDRSVYCPELQRRLVKGEGPFGAPPATGDVLARTLEAEGC